MPGFLEKNFIRIYWLLCLLVFAIVCLRAFFIPFAHDEASTFFFYIQSDNYLPYKAHLYTNNHVLNSALANLTYHIAGSHRFVLRLPNVLAFWVLCFGVFNFFKHLHLLSAKLILTTFFVLTFNFLDLFELCRGYGLSMAFMAAGLSFLQDYFKTHRFRAILLFWICMQLALAANLVLVQVISLLMLLVIIYQVRYGLMLTYKNIITLQISACLVYYWIKFSLFYRERGMLDSGANTDYWKTSFRSLMDFIFGSDALWIQIACVALFALALLFGLRRFIKQPFSFFRIFEPQVFYIFLLTTLIIAVYLQRMILNVNYPEDRTGLFFYLFFALSLTFFFDRFNADAAKYSAAAFTAASLVFFCLSVSFRSFTHYFYHVIPKEIYSQLEQIYKKEGSFTIGGNLNREMNYAFSNYRGGGNLNPMDVSTQMRMNCDYYFALKSEKPYYRFFYDEIGYDDVWDRVLLKRKEPIVRKEIFSSPQTPVYYKGSQDFFELVRLGDTTIASQNCLEAEVELFFRDVPNPYRTFLVFSVNNFKDEDVYYKRIPLYWLGDDLNGLKKNIRLTTGMLPADFKTATVYLWNMDWKPSDFVLTKLKVYELQGKGVNFAIPASYYPLIESITKKPIL